MSKRGENIYRRKDGRYEGRFIRGRKPNGQAIYGYIYGTNYLEVKQKLTEKKTQYQNLLQNYVSQMPKMCVWVREWWKELRFRKLKMSTLQKYEQMLNHHILPYFGMVEINEIDQQMLLDFVSLLREKGMGDQSILNILQLLREVLAKAVDDSVLHKITEIKNLLPNASNHEKMLLSPDAGKKLLHSAEEKDLAILICLYTGIRIGEVCGLQWQDIDEYHRTVTVSRTVQRLNAQWKGQKTTLVVNKPKTASAYRTIPLPDKMIEKLLLLRKDRFMPEEFIFGKQGKPADPRTIQRRFQYLLRRAELPPIRFHDLRHIFTMRLLELGIDAKIANVILGQGSVRTTMKTHTYNQMETIRKAINHLAE